MMEFNGILIAVSLLMTTSTGEAFHVASKFTSTRHIALSSPPPRKSLAPSFGSLRDLVDGGDGGGANDKSNNGGDGVNPRARDEFRNLINFSRSKFADTKFRSRSVYGTGSDERDEKGLHADRLSAFSFSTRMQWSMSEGGASDGEDAAPDVDGDATDGPSMEEKDDARDAMRDGYYDNMVADNFNNMVGTFYSKLKFPSRERGRISDAKDERGLHGDRLSTVSFSSNQPALIKRNNPPLVSPEDDVDESSPDDATRIIDQSFGVDNFHNLIDVSMSKPSQAYRPDPSSATDGLDNHADRLSTFSLSTKEDVPSSAKSTSTSGSGNPIKAVNHDDRLGTFSFASTDPQSGSTSGRGTSSSSPLPSVSESRIVPPQTKAEGDRGGSIESGIAIGTASPTSPQKGSLSSIASSVSIKSRNDRIKDIKEATDPRLLHPDGMNVPRLNSKGDVMTLSSTGGRLNIFQRIDMAKPEINIKGEDGVSDEVPRDIDSGDELNSMILEGAADVGAE